MNAAPQESSESSTMMSLRELRRIEDDRVADERADAEQRLRADTERRLRDQAAVIEQARLAARADDEQRARELAERATRELTERIARIQADADLERERHATERARLEAELATIRAAAPAPARRGVPGWAGIAAALACTAAAALWFDTRLDGERQRAAQADAALADQLGGRLDGVERGVTEAQRIAEDAARLAARPTTTAPAAASRPSEPAGTRPGRPGRPSRPAADPATPPPIKPIDTTSPLGGLRQE